MDDQRPHASTEVLERIESDLHLIAELLQQLVAITGRIDRRLT